MSELVCTCHCGGSMFYRHLHSDSCELSRVGEEAPMSPKKELQALRDEVARLKERMQQAYDYINDHRHGKAKAMLFDGLQLYKQAALTPQAGKGGGNG